MLRSIEICAGAGGQALGLERAGFEHVCLVEIDDMACATLRENRPSWDVRCQDVRTFDGSTFSEIDLLAGGVPCPPFSKAGLQLGRDDDRDLFPEALRLVKEISPKAVLIENVKGLLDKRFDPYRRWIEEALSECGYEIGWRLLKASDFGVPQLRPRVVMVALRDPYASFFKWPREHRDAAPSVGETLVDLMGANGWEDANKWADGAQAIAPTVVGGSSKHGGPDLGPTRAKRAWKKLNVDGIGIANEAPQPGFQGMPRLTVRMVARVQGFPDDWAFVGKKTRAYRQVGNAFPPPVAHAVGVQIARALKKENVSGDPLSVLQNGQLEFAL